MVIFFQSFSTQKRKIFNSVEIEEVLEESTFTIKEGVIFKHDNNNDDEHNFMIEESHKAKQQAYTRL